VKKNRIWLIIVLMSLALLGIAVTQIYWIKSNLTLDAKNFDNKVFKALNEVNEKLSMEARAEKANWERWQEMFKSSQLSQITRSYEEWRRKQFQTEIQELSYSLNPAQYLEKIDPNQLKQSIQMALNNQGIDLDFEYGVYSNKDSSFIIINEHYVPVLNPNNRSSNVLSDRGLINSRYKTSLLATEFNSPGSLMILFPSKNSLLSPTVWPSLFSSLIFTGIILFGFSYTIYVIFNQKKVSEMKTDFINNMTHEFKTPIATISLASDSILSPAILNDESKIRRFVGIIKEENTRMLKQVEKVLQIALIDKKNFQLKRANIDLHELIEKAVGHARLNVEQKNGSIVTDLQASRSLLFADQTHISNIIHNILDNAIKYTPQDPLIEVSTKNLLNGVEIIIRDNGVGMTHEARKHIFDKFYRIPTGNVHNIKGFGLGLSYVKAMVEAHEGKVSVNSEPGKGSEFILFFPQKNVS
jgi:two-component system phosphate regulon sensor histidine kinase PhoR